MSAPTLADPVVKAIMTTALVNVREGNGGEIPHRRTDVEVTSVPPFSCGPVVVRVYGISLVKKVVTVQFVADGRGYSAVVGPKSGRLGTVGYFHP